MRLVNKVKKQMTKVYSLYVDLTTETAVWLFFSQNIVVLKLIIIIIPSKRKQPQQQLSYWRQVVLEIDNFPARCTLFARCTVLLLHTALFAPPLHYIVQPSKWQCVKRPPNHMATLSYRRELGVVCNLRCSWSDAHKCTGRKNISAKRYNLGHSTTAKLCDKGSRNRDIICLHVLQNFALFFSCCVPGLSKMALK